MSPIVGHMPPLRVFARLDTARIVARCRPIALVILTLCCLPSAVRAQTPGYPTATIYPKSESDYAKDFCIIKKGGVWHAFYIHGGPLGENDFEHQTSPDLWNWTPRPNVLTPPRATAAWQLNHVWAPHIVEKNGYYYMFYTGVRDTLVGGSTYNQQHIGLAISNDANLDNWTQIPSSSGVLAFILGPESPGMAWISSIFESRVHFRDAFVMRDPTDASRWLTYYTAVPQNTPAGGANDGSMELGVAVTQDTPGLPFGWAGLDDFGSTFRVIDPIEFLGDGRSDKVESAHVLRHGSDYYLFISGDTNANGPPPPVSSWRGGILVLKNSSPVTDAWQYQGTIRSIIGVDYAAAWFASEAFSEQYSPGLGEDFFCHIDGSRAIEIRQIVWGPSGIQALVQPLHATGLALDATQVFEHTAVTLTINNQWAGAPDGETRIAPIEIEEIDAGGTNEMLSPAQVGLPATLAVTGSQRTYTWNVQRWPDDDATPDVMEFRVGVRGQWTPILEVLQTPPEHDPYREGAKARPVSPEEPSSPGSSAGTNPPVGGPGTLALRVLGNTPPGGGIGLLVDAPAATQARLDLYDPQGRRTRKLIDRVVQAGRTTEVWDGRDSNGAGVRPGLYLARLVTPGASCTVKVFLAR